MVNQKIKEAIDRAGLKRWEVAKEVGITCWTFSVWMREELTGERLARVQAALDRFTANQNEVKTNE